MHLANMENFLLRAGRAGKASSNQTPKGCRAAVKQRQTPPTPSFCAQHPLRGSSARQGTEANVDLAFTKLTLNHTPFPVGSRPSLSVNSRKRPAPRLGLTDAPRPTPRWATSPERHLSRTPAQVPGGDLVAPRRFGRAAPLGRACGLWGLGCGGPTFPRAGLRGE